MGVTQGAGLSLQWFRNQLAPGSSYDELMDEAANAPAGSQGLFWLPYLMGERTPHLDARARGGWIGLTAKHARADLIRAVVEGVSYSQKDCLEIIEKLGVGVSVVRASGGGARSPLWRQILADVFSKPVVRLTTQEGSAYGAALLAMVGTGEFATVPEACARDYSRSRPAAAPSGGVRDLRKRIRNISGAVSGAAAADMPQLKSRPTAVFEAVFSQKPRSPFSSDCFSQRRRSTISIARWSRCSRPRCARNSI